MGVKKFRVKKIGRRSGVIHEFITTVDEEDAHYLRGYCWVVIEAKGDDRNRCYIVRTTPHGPEYLHHMIAGANPGETVSHINGDSLDNRRSNLLRSAERVEEVL